MGYTATQMYSMFMQTINESANDSVLAQEVSKYLNQAQYQLFNEIVYPRNQNKYLRGTAPAVIEEENIYSAEYLSPFERYEILNTTNTGFLPKPANYEFLTALAVYGNAATCLDAEGKPLYPVKYLRKNEMNAIYLNAFMRPTWNAAGLPEVGKHRLYFDYEFTIDNTVRGMQLHPKRHFICRLDYLKRPREIAIKSPAIESPYVGLSTYVYVAEDINCEFIQSQQDEIIRRAVLAFNASVRNFEDMQADQNLIDKDQN